MKKTLVYPYDTYYEPAMRYEGGISGDYKITKIISPRSFGLVGTKICKNDDEDELIVERDFEVAINSVDAVLIVDTDIKLDFANVVYPKIVFALEAGKEVIVSRKLEDAELKLLDGLQCAFLKGEKATYERIRAASHGAEKLEKISTPVIAVFGAGTNTDKYEIQMNLRKQLTDIGYRVSQIGSRHDCELVGFHSFPDFMFERVSSGKEKVLMFSQYVKMIEMKESPDVILIGVPGSVLPLSEEFPGDYGITAFEVFSAVKTDAAICTLNYGRYTKEYFDNLIPCLLYRFGLHVDCITMNDMIADMNITKELHELIYITIESELIDSFIRDNTTGITVYNTKKDSDKKKMLDFIIEQLSSYQDI